MVRGNLIVNCRSSVCDDYRSERLARWHDKEHVVRVFGLRLGTYIHAVVVLVLLSSGSDVILATQCHSSKTLAGIMSFYSAYIDYL